MGQPAAFFLGGRLYPPPGVVQKGPGNGAPGNPQPLDNSLVISFWPGWRTQLSVRKREAFGGFLLEALDRGFFPSNGRHSVSLPPSSPFIPFRTLNRHVSHRALLTPTRPRQPSRIPVASRRPRPGGWEGMGFQVPPSKSS